MKNAKLNLPRASRRNQRLPRWIDRLLEGVQKRFRHARPGSVLILVVALLVLLALIGTAFITTTGTDRSSAAQNVSNTQAELLVDGTIKMAVDQLVRQIASVDPPVAGGHGSFRPATPSAPTNYVVNPSPTFNTPPLGYTDLVYGPWDAHLADRYPMRSDGLSGITTQSNVPPMWAYISASPLAGIRDTKFPQVFPNMFVSPLATGTAQQLAIGATAKVIGTYHSRAKVVPWYVTVTANGLSRRYPAFQLIDPLLNSYTNDDAGIQAAVRGSFNKLVLAADTDGDGIADAGLFELPVGQINGVRYYAAIRIIDNSAAINASIAWESMPQSLAANDPRMRLSVNVFPSNIDLRTLIQGTAANPGPDPSAASFQQFITTRCNGSTAPNLTPIRDDGLAANFQFATQYDAFWLQLGARIDNPGIISGTTRYRSLGTSESAALAYRFCLANPLSMQSEMERDFPNAFHNLTAINVLSPYDPSKCNDWFNNIFNYDFLSGENTTRWSLMPLRPLVTGDNNSSNYVRSFTGMSASAPLDPGAGQNTVQAEENQRMGRYRYRGVWTAGSLYHIGEWVRANNSAGQLRAFVCIKNHIAANAPSVGPSGANLADWAETPWTNNPVKINPNTASFGQLMAAFYAVMADGPEVKGAGNVDTQYGDNTVFTFGNVFRPIGAGATPTLAPRYVKQLRAALAAVNLIDIRDPDDDVTSRTIVMADDNGGSPITAQVYGTERQPYITESMVHITKENIPYVAIELYNPYPQPLQLTAYRLAYRSRLAGGPPVIIDTLNGKVPGNVIPAYGYVYFENDPARRPTINNATPQFPAGAAVIAISGLDQVLGDGGTRELQLLRTRLYSGVPSSSNDPANTFNEANPQDLVPADVLEFTGIAVGLNMLPDPTTGMPVPIADRYHYRRATSQNPAVFTNRWHCVYAGPYNRNASPATQRRERGWVRDRRPTLPEAKMNPPVDHTTLPGWGDKQNGFDGVTPIDGNEFSGDPHSSTFRTRSLPVNGPGYGGPYKALVGDNSGFYLNPAGVPLIPCGGFARNGDILQTTFVGAYRIDVAAMEMNSLSMDSVWAEDGDKADDDDTNGGGRAFPVEQLGRFCPFEFATGDNVHDLSGTPTLTPQTTHRYAWATDLFDYFSVMCPQDDYMPNVDPNNTPGGDPTVPGTQAKWPFNPPQPVPNTPTAAANLNTLANRGQEESVPVHGLVNLNTANWRVIAQLPFTDDITLNQKIAHAIVTYRDTQGPFRNMFELNKISGITGVGSLQNALGNSAATNPQATGASAGDITPYAGAVNPSFVDDGMFGDYEARYLVINRISNMVTFKSDSFTVYVIVQGWRNPGTSAPELVVQRRGAVIVDRSTVKPLLDQYVPGKDMPVSAPTITTVPNN